MKQYFDDLVAGIEGAIAADPESASPRKIYTLEVARLGQRLYGGEERVAWCGITAPFDLLTAMGVTFLFCGVCGRHARLHGHGGSVPGGSRAGGVCR